MGPHYSGEQHMLGKSKQSMRKWRHVEFAKISDHGAVRREIAGAMVVRGRSGARVEMK